MDAESYFGASLSVTEAIDLTKELSCVRMVFMWPVSCFSLKISLSWPTWKKKKIYFFSYKYDMECLGPTWSTVNTSPLNTSCSVAIFFITSSQCCKIKQEHITYGKHISVFWYCKHIHLLCILFSIFGAKSGFHLIDYIAKCHAYICT